MVRAWLQSVQAVALDDELARVRLAVWLTFEDLLTEALESEPENPRLIQVATRYSTKNRAAPRERAKERRLLDRDLPF